MLAVNVKIILAVNGRIILAINRIMILAVNDNSCKRYWLYCKSEFELG